MRFSLLDLSSFFSFCYIFHKSFLFLFHDSVQNLSRLFRDQIFSVFVFFFYLVSPSIFQIFDFTLKNRRQPKVRRDRRAIASSFPRGAHVPSPRAIPSRESLPPTEESRGAHRERIGRVWLLNMPRPIIISHAFSISAS